MLTERTDRLSKRTCLSLLGLMTLVLLFLTGCATTAHQSSIIVQSEVDDVQYLASYGEWVHVPSFGMVWRPDVVADWAPFYYGHWIWTRDGWAWTSYEPYGWLVYHYGYWGYNPMVGWFWVPEDIWWPARVQWYTFGGYTAWAPLPPPGIVWRDPWDPYDVNIWIVVNIDNFTNENIGRHRIVKPPSREIVTRQTVVKNPPDIKRVERLSKKVVPKRKISKQVINVRPQAVTAASRSVQQREAKLKKMVLPKTEKRKVEKHTSRVEREVLNPRKAAPAKQKKSTKRSDTARKKR